MARYFLDTNHLSHALHPRSHLRDRFTAECRKGHVLATNWFVLCEIEAGIAQTARPEKNRSTLSIILRQIRIWPLDWAFVRQFGSMSAEARARGRALSFVDISLAAMARQHKARVITTDRDFSAFPELRVENWLTQ